MACEAEEEIGTWGCTSVLSGITDPRPTVDNWCTYKMAYYHSPEVPGGESLDEDVEAAEAERAFSSDSWMCSVHVDEC